MYVGTRRSDNRETNYYNIASFITPHHTFHVLTPMVEINLSWETPSLMTFTRSNRSMKKMSHYQSLVAKNHNYVADDHNQSYW